MLGMSRKKNVNFKMGRITTKFRTAALKYLSVLITDKNYETTCNNNPNNRQKYLQD